MNKVYVHWITITKVKTNNGRKISDIIIYNNNILIKIYVRRKDIILINSNAIRCR